MLGVTALVAGDSRIEQAIHVAKLGVNYRFGNVAPDPDLASVPAGPLTEPNSPAPISARRADSWPGQDPMAGFVRRRSAVGQLAAL